MPPSALDEISASLCSRSSFREADLSIYLQPNSTLSSLSTLRSPTPPTPSSTLTSECSSSSLRRGPSICRNGCATSLGRAFLQLLTATSPSQVMDQLRLNEGDPIRIWGARFPKGKMIKLQAQSVDFLEVSDPKAVYVALSLSHWPFVLTRSRLSQSRASASQLLGP